MYRWFTILAFCILGFGAYTQPEVDSLEHLLETLPDDTGKYHVYVALNDHFFYSDYNRCIGYMSDAYELSDKIGYAKGQAYAMNELGILYNYLGQSDTALVLAQRAIELYKEVGDKPLLAGAINNTGYIYYTIGNVDECINHYMQSLKLKEELGDNRGLFTSYLNLGYIVGSNVDMRKGLGYYFKALEYATLNADSHQLATAHNNIGYTYFNHLGQSDSALWHYEQSLSMGRAMNDLHVVARTLNNLSTIRQKQGDPTKAIELLQEALEINTTLGDVGSVAIIHHRLAGVYGDIGDLTEAEQHLKESERIAEEINNLNVLSSMYYTGYEVYDRAGDYQKALTYYLQYDHVQDSIRTSENTQIIGDLEAEYQNEKKQLEIANLNQKNTIQEQQLAQKNILMWVFIIGSSLLIGLVLVVFRSYRNKKRDNRIITDQKAVVEEQKVILEVRNKEITDSINYAQRLQEAILPPDDLVKQLLPESFILFKPKDIVSGDFYWLEEDSERIYFAAVDCTGHGVPGAMVSVVGHNGLERCVKEFGLTKPAQILDKLNQLVEETFSKHEGTVRDGMDMALCTLHKEDMSLEFAGANNPLCLVRKGELSEVKADKQPIGTFEHRQPFTNQSVQLQEGDSLYLFSDGYADQFGGAKGKKFKYRQFKELLLSMQEKPMADQLRMLDNTFEDWRGGFEQVDDVCVIGVRV